MPQLEKALAQKRRPNTAIKKERKKERKKESPWQASDSLFISLPFHMGLKQLSKLGAGRPLSIEPGFREGTQLPAMSFLPGAAGPDGNVLSRGLRPWFP